jgi:hypothetical protein
VSYGLMRTLPSILVTALKRQESEFSDHTGCPVVAGPIAGCFRFDVLGSDLSGEAVALARRAVEPSTARARWPKCRRCSAAGTWCAVKAGMR